MARLMGHMYLRYEGYQLEGQELYAQRSQRWVEYISIIYFKDSVTSEIIYDHGGYFLLIEILIYKYRCSAAVAQSSHKALVDGSIPSIGTGHDALC